MTDFIGQFLSFCVVAPVIAVSLFGLWCSVSMLLGRDIRCLLFGHRFALTRLAWPEPMAMRCERCNAQIRLDRVTR